MLLTPAQIKPKLFESSGNSFFSFFFFFLSFFTRGGCVSCLRACLGARLLLQSYQYLNLSEGADRVAGQLRGDKECPFCGVTKSGRVWRRVPESDARSMKQTLTSSRSHHHHHHPIVHLAHAVAEEVSEYSVATGVSGVLGSADVTASVKAAREATSTSLDGVTLASCVAFRWREKEADAAVSAVGVQTGSCETHEDTTPKGVN